MPEQKHKPHTRQQTLRMAETQIAHYIQLTAQHNVHAAGCARWALKTLRKYHQEAAK